MKVGRTALARTTIAMTALAVLLVGSLAFVELESRNPSPVTVTSTSTTTNTVTTTQTLQNNYTSTTTTEETASTKNPMWTYPLNGTITSMAISGDDGYVVAGVRYGGENSGSVLLFNRSGDLLWQYQVDGIVDYVAISEDGSHILANALGTSYGFDSNGSLVWTRAPFDEVMSADGSQVAVAGSHDYIALLTWQGQTLWNDSFSMLGNPLLVLQNGSLFVGGTGGITMFGPAGNVLWTDNATGIGGTRSVAQLDGTRSIALTPSGYLVAASYDAGTDSPGTVMLLSGNGSLLWEHGDEGGADSAAVLPDGCSIAFTTSGGQFSPVLFFSRNGTLLGSLTTDSSDANVFPTSRDTFFVGGGGNGILWLTNSTGGLLWFYPLTTPPDQIGPVAVSGDGNFAAASYDTPSILSSTLYFFNISTANAADQTTR